MPLTKRDMKFPIRMLVLMSAYYYACYDHAYMNAYKYGNAYNYDCYGNAYMNAFNCDNAFHYASYLNA